VRTYATRRDYEPRQDPSLLERKSATWQQRTRRSQS